MKLSSTLSILCYLQLLGVLLLVVFVIANVSTVIEYNRDVEVHESQSRKTIAMIRADGIGADQREMAALLCEALLFRANLHPKHLRDVMGASVALAVLFSLFPLAFLWNRRSKSGA